MTKREWAERLFVMLVCQYEVVAVVVNDNDLIPTLSHLTHEYRPTWRGRLIGGALSLWLMWHLWAEERELIEHALALGEE